jgi:dipeptidyl aminopeptidase/acylaminoacyl peptidase
MKKLFLFSFVSLFIAFSLFADTPKKIPMRDFFRNPETANYKISPNGEFISFTKPYKNRMNIFIRKIDSQQEDIQITFVEDRDIRNYFWKENKTIVYLKDFGGDENYHVFSVNISTKKLQDLTPFPGVKAKIIDDLEDISANEILIGLNKRNKEVFDIFRLNINSGSLKIILENPGNFTLFLTDHNGKLRIAIATDGVNTSIYYRKKEKEKFKNILTTNFKDSIEPLFFDFDNKNLYVASNMNRDKLAISLFDPEKAKELKIIYTHPEVDVYFLNYSKKRKVITHTSFITWKEESAYFDLVFEQITNNIKEKLPNTEFDLISTNKNEDKFIIRTRSDRSRGSYYLYNALSDKLDLLGKLSPWLNEDELAFMKPISYKSRDGLIINGYLTLPKDKVAKNLSIIVNPHGGPWARDIWGYDSEVQFLANRGYAVLQMNFRGSTGYGKKFWEASFKEWGKKMQDDVTDGVKWLIEEGIADEKKICIYGGSYGGYATLAGLTFTPDLYACGVDYVGVANLFTFMKTIPPYWKPYLDMMYEMVGNPERDKELLESSSPAFHVDKIKAPLLVAQGAKDPRVNIDESNQIVNALKARGIDVPYLVKENEGHGFHNEENRFDFYEAMEKFLEKHLGK